VINLFIGETARIDPLDLKSTEVLLLNYRRGQWIS